MRMTAGKVAPRLIAWHCWAPGLETPDAWQAWAAAASPVPVGEATPSVAFLPSLMRRRLSRLSRMMLAAAHAVVDGGPARQCRSVFASRMGEMQRTLAVLGAMARGDTLSPTDFSLTVHNTSSGLFSIAADNRQPSTAIAAGRDTCAAALLEAFGQLQRDPSTPVLVVIAEEALPLLFAPFADEPQVDCAVALLLGGDGGSALRLTATAGAPPPDARPQVLQLAAWLATGPASPLTLGLNGLALTLTLDP